VKGYGRAILIAQRLRRATECFQHCLTCGHVATATAEQSESTGECGLCQCSLCGSTRCTTSTRAVLEGKGIVCE
jgi:translation initiation factor 2 beta subunit (eIF-2beta)/eIF-5